MVCSQYHIIYITTWILVFRSLLKLHGWYLPPIFDEEFFWIEDRGGREKQTRNRGGSTTTQQYSMRESWTNKRGRAVLHDINW